MVSNGKSKKGTGPGKRAITFPNRIVIAPMQMYKATPDGLATDWHFQHLAKYAIGGAGTETDYPAQMGRFQNYPDFLANWFNVGFVIEGSQIPAQSGEAPFPNNIFLEVASKFYVGTDYVPPWPQADVPHFPTTPAEKGR